MTQRSLYTCDFCILMLVNPEWNKELVVWRGRTGYSCVFTMYCVRKRVFSYSGNRFCGSADRLAQVMASMHFPVFLQEKARNGEVWSLCIVTNNPPCKLGLSWQTSKITRRFLPAWENKSTICIEILERYLKVTFGTGQELPPENRSSNDVVVINLEGCLRVWKLCNDFIPSSM